MLRFKRPLLLALSVIFIVLSGCSSAPKHDDTLTVEATQEQSQTKRSNWQRGRVTQRDPHTLDSTIFDDDNDLHFADLWERIRSGLALSDHSTLHPATEERLQWFISRQEYMDLISDRATPYLYYIVHELEKRNMPMEIALLPIVESGFQPQAYSTSNAAGLWQFIPDTGKVFGLEQNWWYDGRRDVIRSTDAALDYLERLYNLFGDWELALAAYNAGQGTVGRAIKRNEEENLPTDFWSLNLPSETNGYIPKLLAVAHLVKHADQYDISLKPIKNKPYLTVVDVGSQIDLALAAELADISLDDLYQLNPGYNRWATAPEGPHKLVLPISQATTFKAALAKLPVEQRIQLRRHEVKPGESLGKIAAQHHTTVGAIQKANKMQSTFVRAGAHLLIPIGDISAEASPSQKTPNGKKSVYRVKAGDSWWSIARQFGTDASTLAEWNKASAADVLHSGQALTIWELVRPTHLANLKEVNYTIQQGDSLWKISRQFNVAVAEIKAWNNLSDRSTLLPGQKLTLFIRRT